MMTTKHPRANRHRLLQSVALSAAVGVGLCACTPAGTASNPDASEAQELADQLNDNLAAVGLDELDTPTATVLYGTDGGVTCENAGELQHELSLAQFGNNALHLRRVVLDPSLVAYDLAVIETYCPDKADDFEDLVADLDTEETIPNP